MNTFKWAIQSIRHPLDFYYDFPNEKRYKLKLMHAAIIILCAVAARVVSLQITGFALQIQEPYNVSVLVESIYIIVPWLTWAAASWGISTIVDGEGKFIDILSSSAFVFVPFIPLTLFIAGLSNIMTSNPNALYSAMLAFMFLYMFLLLFLHVKVIHDFEFKKTFWVIVLSVIGMFIVWFVGLLLFGLINQAISFVITVYKEIMFRR